MAYSESAPPALISQGIGGGEIKIYSYNNDDAAATVRANGYITNMDALGMDVGDLVVHQDLSAELINTYRVDAVTAGGAGDLADATVIGSATDSD